MTRLRSNLVLFAALTGLSACQAARLDPPVDAAIAADRDMVVDKSEIVVVTPSATDARSLIRKARPLGYALLARDTLDELGLTMLTLRIPQDQDGPSAIRELERLEPGVTAGVNHAYALQQSQAPRSQRGPVEYAPQIMRWRPPGCPARQAIGVLDSKLVGPSRLSVTTADFSRKAASEDTLHGTQIVTLLRSSGMLNDAEIYHADVVSPADQLGDVASVDTLVRGLNWLISQDVRLVNVSLAGPYNKILDRAFAAAERADVVIVAPAGNAGPDQSVRYPAAFRSTIAVTAVDAERQIYRNAVRGSRIDFSAPGVDVAVSLPARNFYVSGTSFAAPFVTARIAADAELPNRARSTQIRELLASDADDLGQAGHDPVFGYGLIQAPSNCRQS